MVPHLLSVHLTWCTVKPLFGPSCCEGLHSDVVLCVGHQSSDHHTGGGGSLGGYLFTSAHDTDHIAGESPCFVQCQCCPCDPYHRAIHPCDCDVCDWQSWCCTREQMVYCCILYYLCVICNAGIYISL